MDGLKKLHQEQDDFIKKTFQADKLVSQPIFDNFNTYMEQSKIKVKKYSYKQQKIIILLLFLLAISVSFNVYLGVVKQSPISITTIFQQLSDNKDSAPDPEKENNKVVIEEDDKDNKDNKNETENKDDENDKEKPVNNVSVENTVVEELPEVKEPEPEPEEPINTTITPDLFMDIDTNEVKDFVNSFAIGINRLSLEDETLESNTILLYVAQQYFNTKANQSSLTVDTSYASSVENIHRFLSELTIKDYSAVKKLQSFNNYIGYTARSNSYVYGKDYTTLSKEKYNCTSVTITDKTDNIYTAKANVTRIIDSETTEYEIHFTFKVNSNYKYQKFKLLSLDAKNLTSIADTTIHFVGN